VDYTSKTDNTDFHVEKNTQPATSGGVGGTEVTIEVTFEPSQLGDSKGTLIVSSGQFLFFLCFVYLISLLNANGISVRFDWHAWQIISAKLVSWVKITAFR
jgi:hypothetical protein